MYDINLQHKYDRRGLRLFQRQHLLWYQYGSQDAKHCFVYILHKVVTLEIKRERK